MFLIVHSKHSPNHQKHSHSKFLLFKFDIQVSSQIQMKELKFSVIEFFLFGTLYL